MVLNLGGFLAGNLIGASRALSTGEPCCSTYLRIWQINAMSRFMPLRLLL